MENGSCEVSEGRGGETDIPGLCTEESAVHLLVTSSSSYP